MPVPHKKPLRPHELIPKEHRKTLTEFLHDNRYSDHSYWWAAKEAKRRGITREQFVDLLESFETTPKQLAHALQAFDTK